MISLNFPGEIEVKTFADYVSDRLKISILYDESIRGKRITVRAPQPIPVSSLLSLLQSTLRVKNLALVPAGAKGWYRIVEVSRLTDVAGIGRADSDDAAPVTETFVLAHQDVQRLDQVIKQFLTQPGANSIPVAESNLLIITDYATNLERIRALIESLDQPASTVTTDFYTVAHLSADELCQSIRPIVTAGVPAGAKLELLPEARTNQVTIVGASTDVLLAKTLLERFDVPLGLQTQVYQLGNVAAERVNTIFQELIDPVQRKSLYQATVDEEANLLIVRTTPELHARLGQLCTQIDANPATARNPVRFIKLRSANVDEILQTLRALSDVGGYPPGLEPPEATAVLPTPAAPVVPAVPAEAVVPVAPLPLPLAPLADHDDVPGAGRQVSSLVGVLLPGGVRAAGDPLTNSIILVGEPSAQAAYVALISELDAPRPQVMIEAHIVAIDTSDNFSLGVEVSGGDREGAKRLFEFTSFGLSEVNPVTGALQIIPNLGFNGTLVDPDVADVVVQALAGHSRAHVLASPKILVNDNTRGRFESVLSVPFQSVNASQTVSTTSLGGSQQAGTSINVTPHIKQGQELELEFDVEFSSFSGSSSAGLPPPRQISRAESIVTIPDGHTVIVGGLKQVGSNGSITGVPYLEFVPILRDVTSLRTSNQATTSFFLFIKPVIVRDAQFAELKYLSSASAAAAGISPRFPVSAPILIRSGEPGYRLKIDD